MALSVAPVPSILIIYTGGTIGMVEDPVTHTLSPMKFDLIRDELPELSKLGINLEAETFNPPIDSANMTPEIWVRLAQTIQREYDKYDGFVILHGTDTMAYTASALSYMLINLGKPVIMTGSQLPIGILRTDGRENIITAIQIAAAHKGGKPIVPEVCVYFSSQLFRGNRTTKEDSQQFSAFASHNYPRLAMVGVDIKYNQEMIRKTREEVGLTINTAYDDRVVIIKIFPGMSRGYFEGILSLPNIKGVLLESFGSGNMPTFHWIFEAIQKATQAGLVFLNVSQCPGGRVKMGYYETSRELRESGVVSAKDMTTEAAVTKLMFLLGQGLPLEELKYALARDLSGEIE